MEWDSGSRSLDSSLEIRAKAPRNRESSESSFNSNPTVAGKPAPLAFVNITNPSEASNQENRRFVRQFVKLKKGNSEITAQHGPTPSTEKPVLPTALEAGAWPFIGISHPDQISSPKSMRFVRQQAQQKHLRIRKNTKVSKKIEEKVANQQNSLTWVTPARKQQSILDTHIGAEKLIYPITMNKTAYGIVEYLHGDYDSVYLRPYARKLWFGVYLQDPIAFQELIGVSLYATHMYVSGTNPYEKQILAYHTNALQTVQKRLLDPKQCTSIGIIIAILSLVAHDTITLNFEGYKAHIAGLARIMQVRGGMSSLDHDPNLRFNIIWVDVKASFTFDVPPTFQLPPKMIQSLTKHRLTQERPSMLLLKILAAWKFHFAERQEILKAFQNLCALNSAVKSSSIRDEEKYNIIGLHSNALVYRFMTPLVDKEAGMSGPLVERALRLTSLMYIDRLRERFSEVILPLMGYQFTLRLLATLGTESTEWEDFLELKLWATVVGGSIALDNDRAVFVRIARAVVLKLGIRDWKQVMVILEDILWISEIFRVNCEDFGREVLMVT